MASHPQAKEAPHCTAAGSRTILGVLNVITENIVGVSITLVRRKTPEWVLRELTWTYFGYVHQGVHPHRDVCDSPA